MKFTRITNLSAFAFTKAKILGLGARGYLFMPAPKPGLMLEIKIRVNIF